MAAPGLPLFRDASSGSSDQQSQGPLVGPSGDIPGFPQDDAAPPAPASSSSSGESEGEAPISTGPGYAVEHDPSAGASSPHLIEVLRSDGVRTNWPKPGPFSDSKGAACTWVVYGGGTALQGRWLAQLGKTLAERMGLVTGPSQDWRLKAFPANYRLYGHVKGEREDNYLYGSSVVNKFRTINEFLPHIEYLCRNDGRACQCKYCSGTKRQSDVNTQLGIYIETQRAENSERKAKHPRSKEASQERKRRRASAGPHTCAAAPGARTRALYEGAYVAKDRDRELSEPHCAFRQGEMVWAKLDRPIGGHWRREVEIEYWPAICELRELVTRGAIAAAGPGQAGEMVVDGEFKPESTVGLTVSQRFCWKVRLFGLCDSLLREEDELLPWLHYPPAEELFDVPLDDETFVDDWRADSTNRPSLSRLIDLRQAITPFALALQIAAHVVSFWNLHDRFDMPTSKQFERRGLHLDGTSQAALAKDAQNAWFQSLWWGAEKIWSGELVRLVIGSQSLPSDIREPITDSDERAFFLKITGIYRGMDDRPVVKGAVYELAPTGQPDDDAKEPADEEAPRLKYMPAPPSGYYFRCLTGAREERHLALEHIAGRYYPPSQLVFPPDAAAESTFVRTVGQRSRSLCGLAPGGSLSMKTRMWIVDRKEALKRSERTAEEDMTRHFKQLKEPSASPVDQSRPQVDS